MTASEIAGVIMFFLAVSGVCWGVWLRIDSRVEKAKVEALDRANLALDKVAEHKLHVAENYITKAGMREVKDEIMEAIHGVKGAVDHLGGRIDGIYSSNSRTRRQP